MTASAAVPPLLSASDIEQKGTEIANACAANNVSRLAELATASGGFLTDELRCQACMWALGAPFQCSSVRLTSNLLGPILLGCAGDATSPASDSSLYEGVSAPHADEGQVGLDVQRSFVYYPTSTFPRSHFDRFDALRTVN